MTLVVRNKQLQAAITAEMAVPYMRAVLLDQARGGAENYARVRMPLPAGGFLWLLPARWDARDVMGYKVVASGSDRQAEPGTITSRAISESRAWIYLYRISTGELLTVLEAHHISRCRTVAVSLLGTQRLLAGAPGRPRTLGIYGTGLQARAHAPVLANGLGVSQVLCYGRNRARLEQFAREVSAECAAEVRPASGPREVAESSDLIVTATSSLEPVLHGEWLTDRTETVTVVGANRRVERELDEAAVQKMATMVVADKTSAVENCGDLLPGIDAGWLAWSWVRELPGLLADPAPVQRPALFEVLGVSITDIAIALMTYEVAREHGLGESISVPDVIAADEQRKVSLALDGHCEDRR